MSKIETGTQNVEAMVLANTLTEKTGGKQQALETIAKLPTTQTASTNQTDPNIGPQTQKTGVGTCTNCHG
ncbi:MAG: hypothetical protein ACK481_03360 [Candidatus Melainabacteria bacterium]|jgi:hypothetical protein